MPQRTPSPWSIRSLHGFLILQVPRSWLLLRSAHRQYDTGLPSQQLYTNPHRMPLPSLCRSESLAYLYMAFARVAHQPTYLPWRAYGMLLASWLCMRLRLRLLVVTTMSQSHSPVRPNPQLCPPPPSSHQYHRLRPHTPHPSSAAHVRINPVRIVLTLLT